MTEGSDFNLVFVGCPLNVATHTADQTVQIHENAQKARNDQPEAPKAPGRFSLLGDWKARNDHAPSAPGRFFFFSLFRHFREYEPPGLPYGWRCLVANQKRGEKTKYILEVIEANLFPALFGAYNTIHNFGGGTEAKHLMQMVSAL